MFIILTHGNQSTLSSFSVFEFVTNSPVVEKSHSGSNDVGLIVIKAWYRFSRSFDLFFVASKRLISFFTFCDRISSCAGIILLPSLSWITWILCFDFKWLIKLCAWTTSLCIMMYKLPFVLVEPYCKSSGSKLRIFFNC